MLLLVDNRDLRATLMILMTIYCYLGGNVLCAAECDSK